MIFSVHSEYKNISIRAGSADNESEHRAIVRLLEKTFGDKFPIAGAYDPQFWKSHIGSRFVSLLGISQDKQIVGHLAYAPDREVPGHVQILFPFCDCDCPDPGDCLTKEFGQKAWQAIYHQSQRQNWQAVYFFAISSSKSMQIFAEEVMQASCVAVLPYYLINSVEPSLNAQTPSISMSSHVLVYEKLLSACDLSELPLYAPNTHQSLLTELADNLKCELSFESAPKAARKTRAKPALGSAQTSIKENIAEAVNRTYFAQTEVAHIFVKPSALADAHFTSVDLKLDKAKASYLFVDARDPACIEFSQKLETMGLYFCGLFPFLGGQHNIVFSDHSKYNNELGSRLIFSDSARALAAYIELYKNGKSHEKQSNLRDSAPSTR